MEENEVFDKTLFGNEVSQGEIASLIFLRVCLMNILPQNSGAFYYIRSRDFFTRVVVRAKAKVKMAWWTRNKHCNFYDGFLLNA